MFRFFISDAGFPSDTLDKRRLISSARLSIFTLRRIMNSSNSLFSNALKCVDAGVFSHFSRKFFLCLAAFNGMGVLEATYDFQWLVGSDSAKRIRPRRSGCMISSYSLSGPTVPPFSKSVPSFNAAHLKPSVALFSVEDPTAWTIPTS